MIFYPGVGTMSRRSFLLALFVIDVAIFFGVVFAAAYIIDHFWGS